MKDRSYDVSQTHRSRDAEIQRLAAQARLGWAKEARTLSWFGLRDGMSVLDLGSGPGFIAEKLLEMLPSSSITCLDIDPSLIADAQAYLQDKGGDRVRFVVASVTETTLPDDSFDFVYARLLFQHLPDPVRAAKEVWRILKPGGKFVIYDIDDAMSGVTSPEIPEWPTILERFAQVQAAQGGNRYIGRELWRVLDAAGFRNLDLEVTATHSDALGIEPFLPQMDPDRLLPLVQMGIFPEEEMERIRASHDRFLESPNPYILMLSLMVGGEKIE